MAVDGVEDIWWLIALVGALLLFSIIGCIVWCCCYETIRQQRQRGPMEIRKTKLFNSTTTSSKNQDVGQGQGQGQGRDTFSYLRRYQQKKPPASVDSGSRNVRITHISGRGGGNDYTPAPNGVTPLKPVHMTMTGGRGDKQQGAVYVMTDLDSQEHVYTNAVLTADGGHSNAAYTNPSYTNTAYTGANETGRTTSYGRYTTNIPL